MDSALGVRSPSTKQLLYEVIAYTRPRGVKSDEVV